LNYDSVRRCYLTNNISLFSTRHVLGIVSLVDPVCYVRRGTDPLLTSSLQYYYITHIFALLFNVSSIPDVVAFIVFSIVSTATILIFLMCCILCRCWILPRQGMLEKSTCSLGIYTEEIVSDTRTCTYTCIHTHVRTYVGRRIHVHKHMHILVLPHIQVDKHDYVHQFSNHLNNPIHAISYTFP
jgi:hypothetical protein